MLDEGETRMRGDGDKVPFSTPSLGGRKTHGATAKKEKKIHASLERKNYTNDVDTSPSNYRPLIDRYSRRKNLILEVTRDAGTRASPAPKDNSRKVASVTDNSLAIISRARKLAAGALEASLNTRIACVHSFPRENRDDDRRKKREEATERNR